MTPYCWNHTGSQRWHTRVAALAHIVPLLAKKHSHDLTNAFPKVTTVQAKTQSLDTAFQITKPSLKHAAGSHCNLIPV